MGAVIGQDDLGEGQEVGARLMHKRPKCYPRFELARLATDIVDLSLPLPYIDGVTKCEQNRGQDTL